MEIILKQDVDNLGYADEIVKVKPGYARNYLLPQKKALRANKANLAQFEEQRAQLEAQNLRRKEEAERVAERPALRRAVVVFTDGDDNWSHLTAAEGDTVQLDTVLVTAAFPPSV